MRNLPLRSGRSVHCAPNSARNHTHRLKWICVLAVGASNRDCAGLVRMDPVSALRCLLEPSLGTYRPHPGRSADIWSEAESPCPPSEGLAEVRSGLPPGAVCSHGPYARGLRPFLAVRFECGACPLRRPMQYFHPEIERL